MVRRSTAAVVALCFVVATPVQAGPDAAPADAAEARKWLGEAAVREAALAAEPDDAAHRDRRGQLASEAISAYGLAFAAAPSDCAPLLAGLELAAGFLAALGKTYGPGALTERDYGSISKQKNELEQVRVTSRCPEPARASTPTAEPASGPAPGPTREVPQDSPRPRSRMKLFGAGLGASAGLAIGLGIGAGVLYSRVRNPSGQLYKDIVTAAETSGVHVDDSRDMCVEPGSDAIAVTCDEWRKGQRGMIATLALSGVFAVSTAVFAGLLVREKRRGPAAQAWRRHRAQIGAAPRIGGATLSAGFSF